MAGIGFVLRKLSRQDNLLGLLQAYTHSALASTGPWIFTVVALGSIVMIGGRFTSSQELYEFRLIIIYNFAFSLVFTGPLFMIATRYLADSIHNKDVSTAPGILLGAIFLMYVIQLPIVLAFYILYATMPVMLALSAIANFMLISGIWLISVFLTALKDYKSVTNSFMLGLVISIGASIFLGDRYGAIGIINGFSVGLSYITASLLARVFAEYPYSIKTPFAFLPYFRKYWELALGGLIYNMAAWVDKWVMWFSPEADRTASKLLLYPNYDSAMFLAYLTIVPSMALFVFSIETNFFEKYIDFYRDIQQKATFDKIKKNHKRLMNIMFISGRNFLILQGSICLGVILLAPRIFDAFSINYMQIGIFRYGVLGALFHVLTMFLTIMLSYFDNRRATLKIQILFFLMNGGLTYYFIGAGFEYYGYGYFLASVITFVFAAFITASYVAKLPYHTFITSNTSV